MELLVGVERAQGYRWPADMERRRIAALRKFQRDHPDYVFTEEQLPSKDRNGKGGEKRGPLSVKALSSAKTRKAKQNNYENRWCLATTLELLTEMKAFVRANKLPCIGESMEKWKAIAVHLSNPCGLELGRLARSSTVRFDNLRRNLRTNLRRRIAPEIQHSLIEFFQICERHKTPGSSARSTGGKLSTMHLALNRERSSPSPPPTPTTKIVCFQQTSTDSGELLHSDNDTSMPSADSSTSSDGSDDDDFASAAGDPRPETVESPMSLPPPPAPGSESSDVEDAGTWSSDTVSRVARNRSTRSRLPFA